MQLHCLSSNIIAAEAITELLLHRAMLASGFAVKTLVANRSPCSLARFNVLLTSFFLCRKRRQLLLPPKCLKTSSLSVGRREESLVRYFQQRSIEIFSSCWLLGTGRLFLCFHLKTNLIPPRYKWSQTGLWSWTASRLNSLESPASNIATLQLRFAHNWLGVMSLADQW